ncbi:hypothetical protein CRENBAI_023403 [Crenichthys baileyi]|uniref:Secreted protein n=1 Tax=Crenichthys baileyi TaxID=28760 RepID=A0AAV9RHT7_9TELE
MWFLFSSLCLTCFLGFFCPHKLFLSTLQLPFTSHQREPVKANTHKQSCLSTSASVTLLTFSGRIHLNLHCADLLKSEPGQTTISFQSVKPTLCLCELFHTSVI